MTKTICALVLLTGVALAPATARAQTPSAEPRLRISVNAGAQLEEHSFTTANSFSLYDETATFSASQKIDQGVLFDVGVATSLGRGFAIGGGVSIFRRSTNAGVTASIPSPIFFNQNKTTTTTATGLHHTEVGVNISLVWTMSLPGRIDVSYFVGPSFIRLSQDLVPSVVVATGTQDATAAVSKQSATAKGANFGVDVSFRLTKTLGVGLLIRGVTGRAHPESAGIKVGGPQAGIGLRIRL